MISLLEDFRGEVARLRGLGWSQLFRGDMERASREGTRESSDDPRNVLRRTEESLPLEKPGRPALRSKPDIMADFGRFCFSCCCVGEPAAVDMVGLDADASPAPAPVPPTADDDAAAILPTCPSNGLNRSVLSGRR